MAEPMVPEASFESFFGREYRGVVALASSLAGRVSLGEEIAQDAFLAAYRRWERIRTYDDPAAWVRRVAVNAATSTWRRRAREMRALARLGGRRSGVDEIELPDGALWSAVKRLPPRQAQCVALRFVEDRSTGDIAQILELSESTVRVHLHAARKELARVLDAPLEEE